MYRLHLAGISHLVDTQQAQRRNNVDSTLIIVQATLFQRCVTSGY